MNCENETESSYFSLLSSADADVGCAGCLRSSV